MHQASPWTGIFEMINICVLSTLNAQEVQIASPNPLTT